MPTGKKNSLIQKIIETDRRHGLFPLFPLFPRGGGGILAAVSGGPDSVCLLHALVALKPEFGFGLTAAHFNHKTRGAESDADAAFVEELAKKWNVDFVCGGLDPEDIQERGAGSPEARWREARYDFLFAAAGDVGADRIALGHNADDQSETVLMRIIRGTSPRGAAGMEFVSGPIIRPLLDVTRFEIEEYCRENDLSYRTDSSNADTHFPRNRIRRELIPLLESNYNPQARDAIYRFASLLRKDTELLESLANAALADATISRTAARIALRTESIAELPAPLLSRVLRNAALLLMGPEGRLLDASHIEAMKEICLSKETGKTASAPAGLRLTKKYEEIEITIGGLENSEPCDEPPPAATFEIRDGAASPAGFPFEFTMETIDITPDIMNNPDQATAYFDRGLLGDSLGVRYPAAGDSFHPLGMDAPKKLSDFFIDEKVARAARKKTPLLLSGPDIIWVAGMRIDNRFRVMEKTEKTKSVLKISFKTV